jgi:methionine-rich copper-binding protein CopC/uncharacterized membrane protein
VRILLRGAALALSAAAATLLLAQPASAHADLVRSDPPSGSVLAHAPSVARLWFSEEISPGFSSVRVMDRTGAAITGSRSQVDAGDPRQLTVELPSLQKGSYGLVWRVLAEDDGHATGGAVVFTVGGAAAAGTIPVAASAAGPSGTAATSVGVLLRWLGLCALAGLVGCLAVAGPVLRRARAAAVAAYALHVLTALVWLGALPALVLVLVPRVAGLPPREVARACRGPFSALIVISVTVLVVTGLYGAGRQVPEPGQLLSTSYGRTLVLKIALLAVVGGLGLVNSALLDGRRLDRPARLVRAPGGGAPSRRLIIAEASVGAVLLAAAGLLAETAPPRPPAPAVPLAKPQAYDTTVEDLVVSVSATPNRPGVNGFTVLAASSRRPPPAPIDGVSLKLGSSGTLPLRQIEPGRYFGAGRLDSAGPVTVTAVLRRAGERLRVTVPWRVSPRAVRPTMTRPEHRLAPYLNAVALCVLVLALSAGALRIVVRRRRRRRPGTDSPAQAEMMLEDVR